MDCDLECRDCGENFEFTLGSQQYYERRDYRPRFVARRVVRSSANSTITSARDSSEIAWRRFQKASSCANGAEIPATGRTTASGRRKRRATSAARSESPGAQGLLQEYVRTLWLWHANAMHMRDHKRPIGGRIKSGGLPYLAVPINPNFQKKFITVFRATWTLKNKKSVSASKKKKRKKLVIIPCF